MSDPSASNRAESESLDKATVHMSPLTAPHPLLRSLPPFTHLSADLLDFLNQTYFLHLLANDPSKALPPGKSLLSVLSRPSTQQKQDDELPTLQEKVEEMIHKAFWDEVLHHLNAHSSLLITVFARLWVPSLLEVPLPSSLVSSSCSMTCTPPFCRYSLWNIPSSLYYLRLFLLRLPLFIPCSITAVRSLLRSVNVAHQHATLMLIHSFLR